MTEFFSHLIHEFQLPLNNPVLIFSLILFIILLSPILLKRLNVPSIIGLIISGVVIGPHGLNVLEKTSAVELFSTIGILYIMFIAGLELDMNEFKVNRKKSLLFGFFTFTIPFLLGFLVCYNFLNYDVNASLLTAIMFATHTLVAYPIVSKLGIAKNQVVAITVGGTIIADTVALIILAIIMANSQGNLSQAFWITFGASVTIFSLIMFIVIPRVAKWFFKKLESEKHTHYIFVLSVVFFSAFLAEVAGFESIIGAFIAGLVLNPLIPHSSALMNRIEFIGNSLFIPFFLISVGMLVDLKVIFNGTTALIIALVFTVTALAGKWISAFLAQLSFKYTADQRRLIFGLSSSRAAATLAIVLVGFNAQILDENNLNATILLILVTCIVASFATERAAKKLAITEKNYSTLDLADRKMFNEHILIPVNNLDSVENLLDFALLIKDKQSNNPVTLLSVVVNDEEAEGNILMYRKELEKFVMQGSASENRINTIATIDYNTASGIIRTTREIMADVLIFEWPERNAFFDKLFGEKTDSIIENVDRNIFICRFVKSFVDKNRLVFICPPFAELESGFELIVQKISRISQEFSMQIVVFCEEKTFESIVAINSKLKLTARPVFQNFTEWQDFLVLTRDIDSNDLIVFNSSRKGSVSYMPVFESLPAKFEKHFAENNMIMVYSKEYTDMNSSQTYKDFAVPPVPVVKGIEAIENITKEIGGIFKKK